MTLVAEYLRISREDRLRPSLSPDRQHVTNVAYCQREGLGELSTYEDRNESGTDESRPDWRRLLADIRNSCVSVVVAYDQDRLFRDTEEAGKFRKLCMRYGVTLHLAMGIGRVDWRNTSHMYLFHFKSVGDAMYSLEVSNKTLDEMRKKAARGEKLGGSVPYGYDVVMRGDTKLLVRNEEEQRVVSRVVALHKCGLSYSAIQRTLCEEGHRSKTGLSRFEIKTLQRIVRKASET